MNERRPHQFPKKARLAKMQQEANHSRLTFLSSALFFLCLEHISGLSHLAVMQDVAAKMLCDNLQALSTLTARAEENPPQKREILYTYPKLFTPVLAPPNVARDKNQCIMSKGQFTVSRCAIPGIQAVQAATRHTFSRHTHDQFGIGVIDRGAQKSLSGRGVVEAVAGNAITVNPGEVHDGSPIGDGGRSWRMLYFDPLLIAHAAGEISCGNVTAVEFSRPVIQDARIAAHVRQFFSVATLAGNDAAALLREELLLTLLADVLREQSASDNGASVPTAISHARSLIDDDPTAPVTLADLARASGLSQFQIVRGFAKATGMTPHAYLVQRRMHVARRLIACGKPLVEVAAVSGFADQSHMTRLFVRQYGMSPGAYAAALR
jgi:AraC-like DNA-binding protein